MALHYISSSKSIFSLLWLRMSFCWTFAIRYTVHTSPVLCRFILYLIWSRQNWSPAMTFKLCCFSLCVLYTSSVLHTVSPHLKVHSYPSCFAESKLSVKLSLSKMCQERSTCGISHSISKTFDAAPQSGRGEGGMRNMVLSRHIFPCEMSLQSFSPCEAVMCMMVLQAEKACAESMAMWRHFAGCKRKRTAPWLWCK